MSPPSKRMKFNKPTTSIDDLPPEMISELFEYLPPKDLAACSLVNKRWHSIFAGFKVHQLATADYSYFIKWLDSNQTIREAVWCRPAMFGRLAEKPLLSNLRRLALEGPPEFDLNELNRFNQLTHLEIDIDLAGTIRLNLPSLKVLAFHRLNQRCALSIDCPLLSTLFYSGKDSDLLKVKQPETIRKLKTDMIGAKLVPFKCVECLVTENFKMISKATLQSLARLRELRYSKDIAFTFANEAIHGVGTVDRLKRALSEFLDEAKKLKGNDFRFTFAGFQLTKTMLDQIDFGVQIKEGNRRKYEVVCSENVYMKNYQLIEPGAIDFVRLVDYTSLLSCMSGKFPHCFFEKFTCIEWVRATAKVQDAGQFLLFLKSLRFLRGLDLRNTAFSQEFYDQLPVFAYPLSNLHLMEYYCENELQLNFIGKLSRLSDLVISPLSAGSLPSLVRSIGKLAEARVFVLVKEKEFFCTKERDSTEWKIQNFALKLQFKTENPEEIVFFFKTFSKA